MSSLFRNLLLSILLLGFLPAVSLADRHGRHSDQSYDDRDQWRNKGRNRGDDDRGGREMSLDEAVQMVQRRYNAQVVRTETIREGGRTIYRLRLLNQEGRVWTVTVDASSGR